MLGPCLRATLEHMEALAKAENIRLVSEYKSTQRDFFDPNMTTVILRNLLQNAIKFPPSQTQISLDVKVQENFLIIQVKDEGIGINQEELSKLFALNAKSKIGTQQEQGSGLGLILCKDYSEAQGGSTSAESELGKGSTFTVCLPQELEEDSRRRGTS
ncbi:MAG: hypothetical protein DA405_05435 [Bacteroidetes bacterium]|nr:MAG: hypothetical protein DA405_05435 [Bacteroidota bacterium]